MTQIVISLIFWYPPTPSPLSFYECYPDIIESCSRFDGTGDYAGVVAERRSQGKEKTDTRVDREFTPHILSRGHGSAESRGGCKTGTTAAATTTTRGEGKGGAAAKGDAMEETGGREEG